MDDYVKNRSEIIFLYDVKDANPNGDPLDENRPRIDEETGINLVTDVRLKRTIRDYLHNFKDEEIFVREIEYGDGYIQDAKQRAEDFLPADTSMPAGLNEKKKVIDEGVLRACIDVRLFGATIPISSTKSTKGADEEKKGAITHTGPVQFKIGRSMHKVYVKHFRGTGAFASGKGATQKTFREEDFLPYSLINFYGIINENVAPETRLTERDVNALVDAMWNGTKNLISRSKAGQVPRLLVKVNYRTRNYHIGDLNSGIKLVSELDDEVIRDISEVQLDVDEFIAALLRHKETIESIQHKVDPKVRLLHNGAEMTFEACLDQAGVAHSALSF
ncbi:MAG: type I-B CRISPR-associated protein Cas7/Csh2 [Halobacteriota archaeon]